MKVPSRSAVNEGATPVGFTIVAVLPAGRSVNAQAKVSGSPSGSVDAEPSRNTCCPATTD